MADTDGMKSLGEIVDGLFRDGLLPFRREDFRIWEVWEMAVGPFVAQNAKPYRLRDRVLGVYVTDSIWLQELKHQEGAIRAAINGLLEREAVKKVEFKVRLR